MMSQYIKEIVRNYLDNSAPTVYVYGAVISTEPLKIKIDDKKVLDKDFYTITESLAKKALAIGDKLVLIRQLGGKTYLVLDKVV